MSSERSTRRIIVAGLGNIFLGDDAFGVEVVKRLVRDALPEGVRVLDVGIRSVHLGYELVEGNYDVVILVDAVSRGGEPGTLYVLEPDTVGDTATEEPGGHAMRPEHIVGFAKRLGGRMGRVVIVGCEPASIDGEAGLSDAVAGALDEATQLVRTLCA